MTNRSRPAARQRLARTMAERVALDAQRRRRVRAGVGAGLALLLVAVLGTWWLTRPAGHHATASTASTGPAGCHWDVIPAGARPSEVRDVGTPPAVPASAGGTATMTITTNLGAITVEIDRSKVPCAAANFAYLAGKHFFDNTPCHRLSDTGLQALQCGDPSGTGWGGTPYRYADENLPVGKRPDYPKGVVALYNAGANTNQSQFYLVYADSEVDPALPVLGRVTSGLDIVEQVAAAGHDDAFTTNPDGSEGPGGGHPKKPVRILSLTVS